MKIPAVVATLWSVSVLHSRVAFSWTNGIPAQRPSRPSFLAVSVSDDASSITDDAAQRIYSMPALYDLAFGYRDYEEEAKFLLQKHLEVSGSSAKRILDVAAGPARHGLQAMIDNPDLQVTCIDLSPQMAEYAQSIALDELDDEQLSNFHYIVDDIRTFQLQENSFDAAWILLGSLQHLTNNDEVVQCLSGIHKHLNSKGTVVIELPHPRETFTMVDCTRNEWKVPLDGGESMEEDDDDDEESEDDDEESVSEFGELQIIWGDDNDAFDPITQVRQLTIEMKLTSESEDMQSVKGTVPTRLFTAQEINALAALSGFQVTAMYGALEEGVSVHDEDAAFRMVCLLQKI